MRVLVITIVAMGGLCLAMEFALVDTARLSQQANPKPVEITFHTKSGEPWKTKVTPQVIPGRTVPGKDEERAKVLWEQQATEVDQRRRRDILQVLSMLESSFQDRARRTLEAIERIIAAEERARKKADKR